MKNYIIENWASIVVMVLLIGYVIYLVITKQWEQLRSLGFRLMLEAERVFGYGAGKQKFEYVFKQLYAIIPRWLRLFITEQYFREALQKWYNMIKDYFDNGKLDSSINV